MKTATAVTFALTASALLAPIFPSHAQENVELKLKWPVGSRLVYRMEMKQNSEMQPPGTPEKIKQETNMTQEFAISSLKDRTGGGHELELEILSQKMEMKMNGNVMMTLDTKSPDAASNPALGALAKLVGAKIKYLTNADGTVDSLEGFDEFLAKAGSGSPPQVSEMLKSMLGDKKMNQIASFSNQLPAKPVKVGESWEKQIEMPMGPIGTFSLNQNIKLAGFEKHDGNNCAILETTATISSKAADKPGALGMTMTFENGKMSGKTWFDAAAGRAVETTAHQEFTIKMEMANPQGADKEKIQMTIPTAQDITMKVIEAGTAK